MRNFLLACLLLFTFACSEEKPTQVIRLQLNWLHDPTFTGEYLLSNREDINLKIREGGPGIFPVAEVTTGRADVAVVGADIFLQSVAKDYTEKSSSDLVALFVDFQRNPVGWVLHPDSARRAGLNEKNIGGGKALNKRFFEKVIDGTIRVGDKRGTETTSIWIRWRDVHKVPDDVKVVPVGFNTSIVLSAPMLAYPVYLNEEPYKLSEKIGEPVIVLDPADDGIILYGNVLITTRAFLEKNKNAIRTFQEGLRESWQKAKTDPSAAQKLVEKYYKGVSTSVLNAQIGKTVEFVFFNNSVPGNMDLKDGGQWDQTLRALQKAKLVSKDLSLETLKTQIFVPK